MLSTAILARRALADLTTPRSRSLLQHCQVRRMGKYRSRRYRSREIERSINRSKEIIPPPPSAGDDFPLTRRQLLTACLGLPLVGWSILLAFQPTLREQLWSDIEYAKEFLFGPSTVSTDSTLDENNEQ